MSFAAPTVQAQGLTDAEMARLDLAEIDELIARIEKQVDLVRLGSAGVQAPVEAETSGAAQTDVVAVSNRARINPLCFAENDYPQRTPAALDAYFQSVQEAMSLASSTLTSFMGLTETYSEGNCEDFMISMLASAEARFTQVSRPELSDLTYHLETCWPDEGLKEATGDPLDMDARYQLARQSLGMYRRVSRDFSKAQNWCNG